MVIDEFKTIANTIVNSHVKKWKENGKPVIGYSCTFMPEEIIYAAGMLPFRLRGIGVSSLSIGDTFYGPVICSFPKCVLQLAGDGVYKFLDGAVIVPGCDSMRRLYENWRRANDEYHDILPGFFHYYSVPHKVSEYSLQWFVDETKNLIKHIEEHFSVKITDDNLRHAIKVYNEGRILLKSFDTMRMSENNYISGEDALAVIISSVAMPRDDFNSMLKEALVELENHKKPLKGKKRLMLTGSINDDPDFLRVIEDCGATVVTDALCYGSRSYVDLVEEDGDPVFSIAKRYLNRSYCPRMFGYYKERLKFIEEKAKEARVDGIILQNIRFCDLHGSENGLVERAMEARGIPCMRIEREYGPLVESGRLKMRIEAFLERISKK